MNQIRSAIKFLSKHTNVLIGATLSFAALIRIYLYLCNRGLFLDEVNVARNLMEKSGTDFLAPLEYHQHAPIIFLWIVDTISAIFDFSEYGLRLWPLVAGISSVLLFNKFLKELKLPPILCLLGILFLGFNTVAVKYSLEVKQYSTDMLVAITLLYLWIKIHKKSISFMPLFLFGLFSIFISMPAIFILTAIAISEINNQIKSKTLNVSVLLYFLLWGLLFAANYYFLLKPSTQSAALKNYHESFFLAIPHSYENTRIFLSQMAMILRGAFGKTAIAISMSGVFIVYAIVYRMHQKIIFILSITLLLMAIASSLEMYSLIERLVLFSYPMLYVLFLIGVQSFYKYIKRQKTVFILIVTVSCIIILINTHRFQFVPDKGIYGEGVRDGLIELEKYSLETPLILTHNAWPYYDYYVLKTKQILQNINTDHQILSWDYNELNPLLSSQNSMFLIDAHTFGQEFSWLQDKMKNAEFRLLINEQAFHAWVVE